ncbi:MAG: hypothetical protein WBW58_07120, partial [Candidatus Acidiferrum sp.]
LAFLTRILPKIGPLKVLELRTPTPQAERLFEASFDASLKRYKKLLEEEGVGQLVLPNDNFDIGKEAGPGKYWLNDETQAELLGALAKQNFSGASPGVRAELLSFFADPNAPYTIKRKPKVWAKVQIELEELRKAPPPGTISDAVNPSRQTTGKDPLASPAG